MGCLNRCLLSYKTMFSYSQNYVLGSVKHSISFVNISVEGVEGKNNVPSTHFNM